MSIRNVTLPTATWRIMPNETIRHLLYINIQYTKPAGLICENNDTPRILKLVKQPRNIFKTA